MKTIIVLVIACFGIHAFALDEGNHTEWLRYASTLSDAADQYAKCRANYDNDLVVVADGKDVTISGENFQLAVNEAVREFLKYKGANPEMPLGNLPANLQEQVITWALERATNKIRLKYTAMPKKGATAPCPYQLLKLRADTVSAVYEVFMKFKKGPAKDLKLDEKDNSFETDTITRVQSIIQSFLYVPEGGKAGGTAI